MRYIVVEEKSDADLIAGAVSSVSEDDLSILVSGKGAGLTFALSVAIAKHAPVAFVRSAWTTHPERIRDGELSFHDFVFDLQTPYTPVLMQGVPDIASSLENEEWVGALLDFATSDDYAARNPFEYRR